MISPISWGNFGYLRFCWMLPLGCPAACFSATRADLGNSYCSSWINPNFDHFCLRLTSEKTFPPTVCQKQLRGFRVRAGQSNWGHLLLLSLPEFWGERAEHQLRRKWNYLQRDLTSASNRAVVVNFHSNLVFHFYLFTAGEFEEQIMRCYQMWSRQTWSGVC